MEEQNRIFFDEYTRLDNLCRDLYRTDAGVTSYIENMKSTPWREAHNVRGWEDDLKQLHHLRHIRNHLAHTPGAFCQAFCTQEDIYWVDNFYQRLLSRTDPIALLQKSMQSVKASSPKKKSHPDDISWTPVLISVIVACCMGCLLSILYLLRRFG